MGRLTITRLRATLAVSAALACAAAVATASCGTEQHDTSAPNEGGADNAASVVPTGDDSTLPGNDGSSLFSLDGAAPDGSDACTPTIGCPPGAQCGRYVDPCTGNVFACGAPCAGGQVCASTGGNSAMQSCQPKACAGKCGNLGVDSCGVAINCGGCAAGQDCVANLCVPSSSVSYEAGSSDGCAPLTCQLSAQTHLCGTVHDGCGNSMQCACPAGHSCVGGVCMAPAPECNVAGVAKCGSVQNACGSGSVNCGGCTGANKCVSGTCTPCMPPSCGNAICGSVSNGCGPAVSCGMCVPGEECDDGGCCTPRTCGWALDAGWVTGCAPVDLGCGVKKSCSPCGAGEVCVNAACQVCMPKTCADFGNTGCGHSDGCGHTLNCCPSGETCQGGLCCAPGEVNYNGSCCLPGCDLDLPPGPQVSCGQVLLCAGGGGGSSGGSSSGSAL